VLLLTIDTRFLWTTRFRLLRVGPLSKTAQAYYYLKESEFNKNLVEILFLIYFEYFNNMIISNIDSKDFRNIPYKFNIKSNIQILVKLV
jgi:hypothetical protein